jgi:hypothetical protein
MPWLIFLRKIPREFWYLLAVVVFFAVLRWHWIGVGYDRCMEGNRKAQEAAAMEAKKQEEAAPNIAQDAQDEVKPEVLERVRVIREYIEAEPISCTAAYSDGVQSQIREAKAAADNLRPVPDTKP